MIKKKKKKAGVRQLIEDKEEETKPFTFSFCGPSIIKVPSLISPGSSVRLIASVLNDIFCGGA